MTEQTSGRLENLIAARAGLTLVRKALLEQYPALAANLDDDLSAVNNEIWKWILRGDSTLDKPKGAIRA